MAKRAILGLVTLGLVVTAAFASFYVVPMERTMGPIQRIFYFHAASAWAGMTAFFICFFGNLLYVWRRQPNWDWLGVSAAEVGLAFTTIVLITGPIWAHPVWGIWWTWDWRLTSTFVMWLLYISYLLLRTLI
jgi:heme exporter protein C